MLLVCKQCGIKMAEVRDASIRKNTVILCTPCYKALTKPPKTPDFFSSLFESRKAYE